MLHMQNWRLGEYMWVWFIMVLWFWDVLSLLNPVPRTSGSPAESPRLRCCCDTRDHHLSVAWLIGGQLFQAHSAVLSVLKLCIRLTNWIDLMTWVSSLSRKLTSNIHLETPKGSPRPTLPTPLTTWPFSTGKLTSHHGDIAGQHAIQVPLKFIRKVDFQGVDLLTTQKSDLNIVNEVQKWIKRYPQAAAAGKSRERSSFWPGPLLPRVGSGTFSHVITRLGHAKFLTSIKEIHCGLGSHRHTIFKASCSKNHQVQVAVHLAATCWWCSWQAFVWFYIMVQWFSYKGFLPWNQGQNELLIHHLWPGDKPAGQLE